MLALLLSVVDAIFFGNRGIYPRTRMLSRSPSETPNDTGRAIMVSNDEGASVLMVHYLGLRSGGREGGIRTRDLSVPNAAR